MNSIPDIPKKLKILIADDEKTSHLLLGLILKPLASQILYAKNGLEVLENCKNNPDLDLILLDIKMPVMDGLEASRQIRLLNNQVIIIAQSAFALHSDKEKAMDAGCSDYISKPINKNELIEMIQKHF